MLTNNQTFKFGTVSLVGKTNVGKSTLLNRLIGEKISIISPKVQTTRMSIRGIKTTDHTQIVFLDTPGFFTNPRTKLDHKLTGQARQGFIQVDLILFMVVPYDARSHENEIIIEEIRQSRLPAILLINKIDLVQKEILLPLIDHFAQLEAFQEIFPISALKGENIEELDRGIVTYLPEGEQLYDQEMISTVNLRFIASEIIREKVYQLTHQEIPYSTAIQISNFKEEKNITRIEAMIIVEKESQKGIIIGKKGEKIKKIGTRSRLEIEQLLDCKVFLDLRVRVRKNWRSDEHFLKQLGL